MFGQKIEKSTQDATLRPLSTAREVVDGAIKSTITPERVAEVKERASQILSTISSGVTKRPITYTAAAVGVGLLVGIGLRRFIGRL